MSTTAYQDAYLLMVQILSPSDGVLLTTPGVYEQSAVAVAIDAKAIIDESGATSNHANRLAWAREVLFRRGVFDGGMDLLATVAQDSTVQSSPTDAHVKSVVDTTILTIIPV